MKNREGKPALDAAARRRAVSVARKAAEKGRVHVKSSTQSTRRNQKFSETLDFQQMKSIRTASDALGLEDPYFRIHDDHARTRSRIEGREVLNFSSYDYLGVNADPRPAEAAIEAIRRYGVSASASRMVAGTRPVHRDLEMALAQHYGCEAA